MVQGIIGGIGGIGGGDDAADGSSTTTMSKAEAISLCLSEPDVDLWRLRELALTDGGLVSDALRRRAWPKLLGIDRSDPSAVECSRSGGGAERFVPDGSGVPTEAEMDQVERDVTRCTWHLLTLEQRRHWKSAGGANGGGGAKKVTAILKRKQKRLGHLINMVLRDGGGDLRYYQGYHDVSSVFLSTMGSAGLGLTKSVLYKLSLSHFRDATKDSFADLTSALRIVIMPLLAKFDSQLHSHLSDSGVEPFFALSWVLTWFSHDVKDTAVATRLFDAFLVSHPLLPVYVTVAMVLHPYNRQLVLGTDCDFAEVHNVLCGLPRNTCSVGWRSDGAYGSDDEMDGGDGSGSRCTDTTSSISHFSVPHHPPHDSDCDVDQKEQHGPNITVDASSSPPPPVPVQDLINSAIGFMRHVPPRDLLPLARRYQRGSLQPLLKDASSIDMLRPPPVWALQSTVPSDWVLKQRARARNGLKSTTRKERKRHAHKATANANGLSSPASAASSSTDGEGVSSPPSVASGGSSPSGTGAGGGRRFTFRPSDLSRHNRVAVTAAGAGPADGPGGGGGPVAALLGDRTVRILLWGGVAIAIISVTWALVVSRGAMTIDWTTKVGCCEDGSTALVRLGDLKDEVMSSSSSSSVVDNETCASFQARPVVTAAAGEGPAVDADMVEVVAPANGNFSLMLLQQPRREKRVILRAAVRFLRNLLTKDRETFWSGCL